jgi:uncharacterized alpha-E superfamily protein
MLARIAQELFWLGRDVTRAEHTARMLDGAFHADVAGGAGGGDGRGIALSWAGVLAIIGAKPPVPGQPTPGDGTPKQPAPGEAAAHEDPSGSMVAGGPVGWASAPLGRSQVAPLLTLDTSTPASIVSCVARARERASTLRDVISAEMWESLNAFDLSLSRYDLQAALLTGPYSVYREIKERCALFWGLLARTMLRDEARCFLQAGGRIEEADMVLRLLRVTIPPGALRGTELGHEDEAIALLQASGGAQAYRRAVRRTPTLGAVTRFLLYESSYPGSVAASLQELREALQTADAAPRSSPPVLRLGRLIADLELQQRAPQGDLVAELLEQIQDELALIDRDIDERYFARGGIGALVL